MSSLVFLVAKKFKNRFKEILHRPSELIVLLLSVAAIGICIFAGNRETIETQFRDVGEFEAIVFALYAFVFVLVAKNGFVNGASMFSMADVNLLFTGPHKPQTLLSFGLFSQLGRSLMLGVFIIYQYAWVHDTYGVTLWNIIAVVIGYSATVFLAQMAAMLIYSFTSSSDKKCKITKAVFYLIVAAFVAYAGYIVATGEGGYIQNAVDAAHSTAMKFFPVVGFLHHGVVSAMNSNFVGVLVAVGCFGACIAVYYILISFLNTDYYEDVLAATEVSFSAITARKEGKAQETAPRNVKVGKIGIQKGFGASVIAEKHKIENRRSKFLILDLGSLVMAITTIVFAVMMKDALTAFAFSTYMMVITVGVGRWSKELLLPYVYLIPEPPFKKLLHNLREQIPSLIAQSVVTFVPLYFILYCSIPEIASMIIARVSFGWLFISVNLIMQRIFGSAGNKALQVMVLFLLCALMCVPAIAVAVAVGTKLAMGSFLVYLSMAAVNALVGTIAVFACRNVLDTAQLNNR